MSTPQNGFDADAALSAIKTARAAARRRCTWGKSKLTKHRAELVKLRIAGASYADLALWLQKEKRVKIDRSNVRLYLIKLPEMIAHG
jgi:hypothetical protein